MSNDSDLRKGVLILGAGIMQIVAIEEAKSLGYMVVAADKDESAPGFAHSDVAVAIDTKNHEALIKSIENHPNWNLAGIFAGADNAVSAAIISTHFGLGGINPEVALRSNNKKLMKDAWVRAGVATPKSIEVSSFEDGLSVLQHFNFPVMIKAVDSAASRGSRKVNMREELKQALTEAFQVSTTGTALVEEYVCGHEYSVETIVNDGVHHRVSIAKRIFGFHPYHIEIAHVDPVTLDEDVNEAIFELVKDGAIALGIDQGPAKADVIVTEKGPMLLEIAARLSGGFHSQYTTPYSVGRRPIKAVLRQVVEGRLDHRLLESSLNLVSVCHGVFPEPGRIVKLNGLNKMRSTPGIRQVICLKKEGDLVRPYRDNSHRFLWVISCGETEEIALASFDEAVSKLELVIDGA